MKVLILNPAFGPNFVKSARWFARSRGRVQRHPDYLAQATAVLEQGGHECSLIDGAAKNMTFGETENVVKGFNPDLVVIQASTPSIDSDITYASMCKQTKGKYCITVLVGPHVSAMPEDTLVRANGAVDIVTLGEYGYTLLDIANGKDCMDILGISYFDKGTPVHNSQRPLIEELDDLPFPAWHHIDPYDYLDAGKLYPFITLMSGRGCESHCTFCVTPQVMYGQKYRARSAELVVDEIEYDLRLFPFLKEIMFEDDTLTLKRHQPRLINICEEILRRRIKISWSANARADIRDIELLRLMKKAGCRWLCVGFEFGNQKIVNNVRKGTKLEHMREFAELANHAGIQINGCFMIGGPGETRETALETIEFAKQIPLTSAQFTGVVAYPGTEYYQWASENGYLVPQDWPKWVDENHEQRTVVSLPSLTKDQIDQLVDKGLKEFYLRPSQILRVASHVQSWADVKSKLYGLLSFTSYFKTNPGDDQW